MEWLWNILCSLALGALAGWIAGKIMGNSGTLLRNILLGMAGGVVGGIIAKAVGLGGGLLVQLLIGVGGACLVLVVFNLLFKK